MPFSSFGYVLCSKKFLMELTFVVVVEARIDAHLSILSIRVSRGRVFSAFYVGFLLRYQCRHP
jgi:hypothetical protein